MNRFFDFHTASFGNALALLIIGIGLIIIYFTRTTYPGFRRWILATFAGCAGVALFGLRGMVPTLVSVIIANAFIVGAISLIYSGFCAFNERPSRVAIHIPLFAGFLALMLLLTYWLPSTRFRTIVISAVIMFYCAALLFISLGEMRKKLGANWLLDIGFSIQLVWSLGRAIVVLSAGSSSASFTVNTGFLGTTMILAMATNILTLVGLSVLNFQRTERELLDSRSELNALRGIIPICASCKRVRDDAGYWSAVENYVSSHAQVAFSHSICPECRKKLYGKD